jgi:hypothetical protein
MADALHRLVEGNKYLSGVLAADRKSGKIDEYMADGFRGRPDVDLAAWAKARGLRDIGNRIAPGYLAAFTWSEDCQFNVVRGGLPGGEEGVLYHEARPLDDGGTPGLFYGKKVDQGGPSWWKPDFNIKRQLDHMLPFGFGGEFPYFLSPFTTAAVRIPEGVGTLSGLYVARTFERYPKDDEVWEAHRLEADGLPDWFAGRRRRGSDEMVFADVVRGPVRELLQR